MITSIRKRSKDGKTLIGIVEGSGGIVLYDMAHRKHGAASDAEEAFSAADYAVANPPYKFCMRGHTARPNVFCYKKGTLGDIGGHWGTLLETLSDGLPSGKSRFRFSAGDVSKTEME